MQPAPPTPLTCSAARGPHAGALIQGAQGCCDLRGVQHKHEAAGFGFSRQSRHGVELQAAAARLPIRRPPGVGGDAPQLARAAAAFARANLRRSAPHTQGPVHSVAFSPTAPLIASGSKDKTVRLWQPTVCVPPPSSPRTLPASRALGRLLTPPLLTRVQRGALDRAQGAHGHGALRQLLCRRQDAGHGLGRQDRQGGRAGKGRQAKAGRRAGAGSPGLHPAPAPARCSWARRQPC